MKDTLIKTKNNSQGKTSSVDEAKNQSNDLKHKEKKNNKSEQEGKRIKKNQGQCKQCLGQLQAF